MSVTVKLSDSGKLCITFPFSWDYIKNYLLELIEARVCKHSYIQQAVSAIKFYYFEVLNKKGVVLDVPYPRKEHKLPSVLSQKEVADILSHTENLKHKTILLIIYAAGLRVGEVVRLRAEDIDENRMVIRVVQGKGKKDRYTLLSLRANQLFKEYVGVYKPDEWLFEGEAPGRHLNRAYCTKSI